MQNQCAEIKLRAERRAGELLKEQAREPGQTDKTIRSHGATISAAMPKLEDIGINKSQSSRWQQIADVPEDKFNAHICKVSYLARNAGIHNFDKLQTLTPHNDNYADQS